MKTLSKELAEAIRPLEMKLKLLWIGVFPVFGIYIFIAWQQAMRGRENAGSSPQMLMIAVFLCLTVLVQSLVFRWLTLSPRAITKVLSGNYPVWLKMVANPDSPKAKAVLKPEYLDALEGDERKLYEYSSCLFSSIIIQWGMVNTCALFGMILPPVQYQPMAAIIAGVLSAGCMLFHFPSIGRTFVAGLELAEFEKCMHRE